MQGSIRINTQRRLHRIHACTPPEFFRQKSVRSIAHHTNTESVPTLPVPYFAVHPLTLHTGKTPVTVTTNHSHHNKLEVRADSSPLWLSNLVVIVV
jgi:hypothetical protein